MVELKIDQIIRSKRKSIGLQINKDASLTVRAPHFASETYIYQLIERKRLWITKKQEYFKQKNSALVKRQFLPGEEFLFFGERYILQVKDDLKKAVDFDNALYISPMVVANARDHLEIWFKEQALIYIKSRTDFLATNANLRYTAIKINSANTRYGSCSYTNTLNFTWRLIMAPKRVIDYVIVHELMHLKQKNHSHLFWEEVLKTKPDYKEDALWLKNNGHLLNF